MANQIGFPFYIPNPIYIQPFQGPMFGGSMFTGTVNVVQGPPVSATFTGDSNSTYAQAVNFPSIGVNVQMGYNFYQNGAPTLYSTDARGFFIGKEGAGNQIGPMSALLYSYGADSWFKAQLENNQNFGLTNVNLNDQYGDQGTSNYMTPQMELGSILLGQSTYTYNVNNTSNFYSQNMGKTLSHFDITGVQYPGDLYNLDQNGNRVFFTGEKKYNSFNAMFPPTNPA